MEPSALSVTNLVINTACGEGGKEWWHCSRAGRRGKGGERHGRRDARCAASCTTGIKDHASITDKWPGKTPSCYGVSLGHGGVYDSALVCLPWCTKTIFGGSFAWGCGVRLQQRNIASFTAINYTLTQAQQEKEPDRKGDIETHHLKPV